MELAIDSEVLSITAGRVAPVAIIGLAIGLI
jgi:hypothetical protein